MPKSNIKTHNTESFKDAFMQPGQQINALLKTDFGKFFIVRVEDLFRLMKLPVPPTRATTHTLIYLTEGDAIISIGSVTYTVHQEDFLVVPAGQVFSFGNPDVNKGFLCNFHDDFMLGNAGKNETLKDFEFLHVWGNPRISLDQQTSKFVLQLMTRLYHDYSSSGLKNSALLQAYLIALLCEIANVYKPLSNSHQTKSVTITNQFKALLFSHIRKKHLVTDYAALLHITPNHLNKTIKQITGKSPTKWIDETLMLEAKVLLYQTDLAITAVAAEIGIFDPSYFSRLFRKYEGVTPLGFRKMIEKS